MAFFMIFTILSFLGIVGLLWCFKGFSRELNEGRSHHHLVRVEQVSRVASRAERKKVRTIEFERETPQVESQETRSAEAKSEVSKLRAASVIAVAILLGSR
jgi:cytoskeletal protein RodZ